MGAVDGISAGRKLMRGSWNAQPYGVLNELKNGSLAAGTDIYFNKNRLSGLWGAHSTGIMVAGERDHGAVLRRSECGSVCVEHVR
jgi:hypothetical protein